MGRLIDADAFERSVMCSDAEDMQDVIYALRDYPTAYDPDKVVEQLEEVAFERYGNDGMGGERVVNLDDVIKIVRGGGLDG
jgi:hypothetical protein